MGDRCVNFPHGFTQTWQDISVKSHNNARTISGTWCARRSNGELNIKDEEWFLFFFPLSLSQDESLADSDQTWTFVCSHAVSEAHCWTLWISSTQLAWMKFLNLKRAGSCSRYYCACVRFVYLDLFSSHRTTWGEIIFIDRSDTRRISSATSNHKSNFRVSLNKVTRHFPHCIFNLLLLEASR